MGLLVTKVATKDPMREQSSHINNHGMTTITTPQPASTLIIAAVTTIIRIVAAGIKSGVFHGISISIRVIVLIFVCAVTGPTCNIMSTDASTGGMAEEMSIDTGIRDTRISDTRVIG